MAVVLVAMQVLDGVPRVLLAGQINQAIVQLGLVLVALERIVLRTAHKHHPGEQALRGEVLLHTGYQLRPLLAQKVAQIDGEERRRREVPVLGTRWPQVGRRVLGIAGRNLCHFRSWFQGKQVNSGIC